MYRRLFYLSPFPFFSVLLPVGFPSFLSRSLHFVVILVLSLPLPSVHFFSCIHISFVTVTLRLLVVEADLVGHIPVAIWCCFLTYGTSRNFVTILMISAFPLWVSHVMCGILVTFALETHGIQSVVPGLIIHWIGEELTQSGWLCLFPQTERLYIRFIKKVKYIRLLSGGLQRLKATSFSIAKRSWQNNRHPRPYYKVSFLYKLRLLVF